MNDNEKVRSAVREQYGAIARGEASSCAPGCCGSSPRTGRALGYSEAELGAVPDGVDLGLGCGNPQAIAALRSGEVVLDLGAGAGFDCFLAARQVGPTGRVIGVDMTAEMIARARGNAEKIAVRNVDFRLGEIEHLPVGDADVDVVISNCVINLSPDKEAVFREAFRVLRPGGRLAISDVVLLAPLPDAIASDLGALSACVSGAASVETIEKALATAGFGAIRIDVNAESRRFIRDWLPGSGVEEYIASASIEATKPGAGSCCAPSCCQPGAKG